MKTTLKEETMDKIKLENLLKEKKKQLEQVRIVYHQLQGQVTQLEELLEEEIKQNDK